MFISLNVILSSSSQAVSFFAAAFVGVFAGILFDLFRVFRRVIKHKTALTVIEDIFFWLITSVMAFAALLYINDGVIRFYLLLGAVIGFVIYFCTIGSFVVKWLAFLIISAVSKLSCCLKYALKKIALLRPACKSLFDKANKKIKKCSHKA